MTAKRAKTVTAIAATLFVAGVPVAAPVLAGHADVARQSVHAAASAPTTSAHSQADLGCRGEFIEPARQVPHPPPLVPIVVTCTHVSVDAPPDVLSWTFNNDKTITGSDGTSMSSGIKFAFSESTDGAGNVVLLTVHIELSATVTTGGDSVVSQSFETSFNTNAAEVSVGGNLSGDAKGTDLIAGDGSASIDVDCGDTYDQQVQASGGGGDPPDVKNQLLSSVMSSSGECSVTVSAGTDEAGNARTNESGVAHSSVDLTVTAGAPGPTATPACALQGLVTDGAASDNHDNPLPGIRVQLWQSGSPVGSPEATDASGHYCILAEPGVTDPGSYKLRATLIDAAHDPPLFETRYATETEPTFVETDVTATDFGGPDKDVAFTGTDTSSRLADIANIHYQSERFIRWVTDTLGVSPSQFGHVTIVTFDTTGDSTRYQPSAKTVYILAKDSPYAERNRPNSDGPENDEWHEISHHLAYALGIALAGSNPSCSPRVNHAGWPNPSTCDSLQEGFSMFLPTLASLDIDASTGPGYGTPDYAIFGSLEDNGYSPWDIVQIAGKPVGREDLAIAQLLWDLADNTPDESPNLYWTDPSNQIPDIFPNGKDEISIGGLALVRALVAAKPQTVADIYDALRTGSIVTGPGLAKTIDINQDNGPDLSPLDEAYLFHGFAPVRNASQPDYTLGDPIARTDHVPDPSGGLVARRDIEETPGEAVLLVNSTTAPITFSLDITYPTTSSHFPIVVAANSSLLVHQELPPYWRQVLAPGAPLPDCGGQGERLVTMTLSGSGLPAKAIDSCTYLHAAQTATDGAAVTFGGSAVAGASPTSPGTTATPPPQAPAPASDNSASLIVIVVAGAAVLAIGALVLVVLSRRRRSP